MGDDESFLDVILEEIVSIDLDWGEFLKVLFVGVLVFLTLGIIIYGFSVMSMPHACIDGTLYDSCADIPPLYCEAGFLVEKASLCGCPEYSDEVEDICVNPYAKNPLNITLNYTLRGEKHKIDYVLYGGLMEYLYDFPKTIFYTVGSNYSRTDFKLRSINEPRQREMIFPLVMQIRGLTSDESDQVRIATSLVQNIPFGFSNKTINVGFNLTSPYHRYPYEVLYENQGICGEKSELLALILKELGYEVVLFYHQLENHESVGVKCPKKYSLGESGYCFIETTGAAIITNDQIEYVGGLTLKSTPEIMLISEGKSLPKDLYEYDDAELFVKLENKANGNGRLNFLDWNRFNSLKEKYGLVDYYDPR